MVAYIAKATACGRPQAVALVYTGNREPPIPLKQVYRFLLRSAEEHCAFTPWARLTFASTGISAASLFYAP